VLVDPITVAARTRRSAPPSWQPTSDQPADTSRPVAASDGYRPRPPHSTVV